MTTQILPAEMVVQRLEAEKSDTNELEQAQQLVIPDLQCAAIAKEWVVKDVMMGIQLHLMVVLIHERSSLVILDLVVQAQVSIFELTCEVMESLWGQGLIQATVMMEIL